MFYFLFAAQQWLTPAMLISLTVAVFVVFRRRPSIWSCLLLIAGILTLVGYFANTLSMGAFSTQTTMPDGSVRVDLDSSLLYVSLSSQVLASLLAIAGCFLTLRNATHKSATQSIDGDEKKLSVIDNH